MPNIQLHAGDITRLRVDAIVNAANESLLGGGGVDGAIHAAAGPELVEASRELAPCPSGEARITPGFDLVSRYVIHAVGPIFRDGGQGESKTLANTYRAALQLANDHELDSIAFPCISTGAYRFPQTEACHIALRTAIAWQKQNQQPNLIVFCCFEPSDFERYMKRLDELGILRLYEG